MSNSYLNRKDAPFKETVWDAIDQTIRDTARAQLTVRRLLPTEGPLGFGVKSLPTGDRAITNESEIEAAVSGDPALALPLISSTFSLAARDIDAFQRLGMPLNLQPAVDAAIKCAAMEDRLLLGGAAALGIAGLTNNVDIPTANLSEWTAPGDAVGDILSAIELLDAAGHHGPYALAVEPSRYGRLFKRYPQGPMLEMAHIKEIIGHEVIKASGLQTGGLLVDVSRPCASIVIGQDLETAFEGPSGKDYVFVVSESLTLRVTDASAVCRLIPSQQKS